MNRERISIAAVQETKLNSRSDLLSCAGFNIIRKDRERDNGGGLAFILHNTVQYRQIDEDIDTIRSGDVELEIFNIYIPPVTCCPTGYHPNIGALLRGETRLVLGDFNAHHDLWHSSLSNDRRGMELAEQIDDSTFYTMNDEAPTRVMGTCNSSPDITIASGGLINSITWRPMLTLASDHLPIIISIEKPLDFVSVDNRTFINFKKANWVGFTEFTESTFNALPIPTDVCVGERQFRKVIAAATARFIPAGRIAEIRPNFPAEAAVLANERDTLRHADPGDPRIRDLNLEIRRKVNQHKRTKWIEHLKSCNLSTGVSKLWATVKALANPKRHDDRVEVQFNGHASSDSKKCASYFSRQFTLHPSVDKAKRCVNRRLRKMPNNCAPLTFTDEEVQGVINKAKSSRSIGPDGINMLMLKHLGSTGVKYLTKVLNLSLTTLQIPDVWKVGRVVPLLKPGKPANKGESYRPITLLSPVVKTLEALLLPTFTHHLSLASHQHGFRKVHNTTTALSVINAQIVRGLNQKPPCERTILVALDLSKAFDTVNHTTLLQDIEKTTLPPGLKRWTMNYLNGRQSSVLFRGETGGSAGWCPLPVTV
ncbi:probable RNA-directed DNA polymerase from transposon X-element isoform X1 [Bactrocera dorsalis]|uniref:Probable RNA-directed DNA polymerase from transposon X-element isoform X1 n=1 Tax=Bactrocera dorsalis TaxID=27457 RepID=A0ABM3KAL3_BACDO|nr:probable RNA-directed DNA polymerase from transposon X-element isoform X1 [Bactrocera dorsalis]